MAIETPTAFATRPELPERPDELELALEGRLTQAGASELRASLTALASRRPHRLVLDLRRVTFVDAAAVTAVHALERRLAGVGGQVVVRAGDRISPVLVGLGVGHLLATD